MKYKSCRLPRGLLQIPSSSDELSTLLVRIDGAVCDERSSGSRRSSPGTCGFETSPGLNRPSPGASLGAPIRRHVSCVRTLSRRGRSESGCRGVTCLPRVVSLFMLGWTWLDGNVEVAGPDSASAGTFRSQEPRVCSNVLSTTHQTNRRRTRSIMSKPFMMAIAALDARESW
jgi:hypothetical protein